jgi:hypothetical protein
MALVVDVTPTARLPRTATVSGSIPQDRQ